MSLVHCASKSVEGVVVSPALALSLVFLERLGLSRSVSCWLMCYGSLGLLTNWFCVHKVVMKALKYVYIHYGFVVMAYSSFVARPLTGWCVQCGRWPIRSALLGRPNDMVRDCWALLCQCAYFRVRNLGGAEWSCRRCTGPVLGGSWFS
jgi:hypothetical protein